MIRGMDFFPLFFSFSPWRGVEGAAGDKGLLCEGPGRLEGGGQSRLCPARGPVHFPDVAGLGRAAPGPRGHRTAGRHRKLSLSCRCRALPAPRCGERGARGRRAEGWAVLAPTFPAPVRLDCRGLSAPRVGAQPELRESPRGPAGRCFPRPECPAPARRSPGFVLRGGRAPLWGAARSGRRTQRPAAFRDASVWQRGNRGGEGEGKKKEEWGDDGCLCLLSPSPEPRGRASPKVRAAPRPLSQPAARIPAEAVARERREILPLLPPPPRDGSSPGQPFPPPAPGNRSGSRVD